jgi:DNA-binding transcriptional ArsR family regulator
VEEAHYRQSRLCRVLGNPVAFAVVRLLAEHKEMTPSEIARAVGRSVSRISNLLAALRLAEMARYDTDGRSSRYRLKHPREARRLLDGLAGFVKTASAFRHER